MFCRHLAARVLIPAVALGVFHWSAYALEAQDTIRFGLRASVLPFTRLEVDSKAAPALQSSQMEIASSAPSIVRLTAPKSEQPGSRTIRLPIVLRSNCDAQLIATSSVSGTTMRITQVIAGGVLVRDEALVAAKNASEHPEREIVESLSLLEAPRISAGGRPDSRANALSLTLEFRLPAQVSDQPVQFTLSFQSR